MESELGPRGGIRFDCKQLPFPGVVVTPPSIETAPLGFAQHPRIGSIRGLIWPGRQRNLGLRGFTATLRVWVGTAPSST